MSGLADLHRRAVQHSLQIVDGVTAEQLARPTPCAGWTLADLLEHMIAQHIGFAASADGNTSDASVWAVQPIGLDPAGAYRAAAERVLAAFGVDDLLERTFWLPEIRDGGPFPAQLAVGFHLLDYVAHGWDVAASTGTDSAFDPDVVAAAIRVAERVPNGPERNEPGAAFRPALDVDPARAPLERLLLMLGRSPSWTAA